MTNNEKRRSPEFPEIGNVGVRSFPEMENIGNSGVSGNRITSKYTYLGNSPEFQVVLELWERILTPVGKMLNIFKICLAEKVQCNHRPRIDQIYNVPCHATLLYPNKGSGYIQNNVLNTLQKTTTFKMYPTKWSHLVQTLDIL